MTLISAAGGTAPALDALRLSLHVLAASVWVGGQITLAGLVPSARRFGTEVTSALARAFARLSWPAYALLVLTGFWNIAAVHPSTQSTAWQVVLGVKLGLVVLAGVGAFLHGRAESRTAIAIWGAVTGVSSLATLVLGVVLAG